MSRLLIKGAESALPTGSGTASTFDSATVVRVVNTSESSDHVVTVVESAGGTVVGSFTLVRATSELIEKQNSHAIFAENTAVRGSKVGYTN
tara:strand:+ start:1128 stop:1400 length:273 start_codon:yes stop_codon:yes gene_type:complete